VRSLPSDQQINSGRLPDCSSRQTSLDGLHRPSGRTASERDHPINHHVAGPRGPRTKVRLGARAHDGLFLVHAATRRRARKAPRSTSKTRPRLPSGPSTGKENRTPPPAPPTPAGPPSAGRGDLAEPRCEQQHKADHREHRDDPERAPREPAWLELVRHRHVRRLLDWLGAEGATVGCSHLVQSIRVSHPSAGRTDQPARDLQLVGRGWLSSGAQPAPTGVTPAGALEPAAIAFATHGTWVLGFSFRLHPACRWAGLDRLPLPASSLPSWPASRAYARGACAHG
jgi:hypothetical protein